MRKGKFNKYLSVHAIAGSHVITLAFDMPAEAAKSLMGFAIFRTKYDFEGKKLKDGKWAEGYKPFEKIVAEPKAGQTYSTCEHPWQSYTWADFAIEQNIEYEYKVYPMSGEIGKLKKGTAVTIRVRPEPTSDAVHEIFFNRGVSASQAYAERFGNIKPNDPSLTATQKQERLAWLSRGLFEAAAAFITQAKDKNYGLRAALYELDYPAIPTLLKQMADKGADLKIIYEATEGESQTKQNQDALKKAGVKINDKKITFARKNSGNIPHNKFIVLLKNEEPIMVWTGSTNFSEGGIFGHSNVGHCIKDKEIAQQYLDYWKLLKPDPEKKALTEKLSAKWPDLHIDTLATDKISVIFSPRKGLKTMDFYADMFAKADTITNITLPFNFDKRFLSKLENKIDVLRYAILNSGKTNVQLAQEFNPKYDIIIAPGSKMEGNWGQWLKEINPVKNGQNVLYIHDKFMLIDPLGENPFVITGSANFSENSVNLNDENMVVIPCSNIEGKTRVQDIYLGEFFRLFDHLYFRYLHSIDTSTDDEKRKRRFLKPTPEEWVPAYYKKGADRYKRRINFSFGFGK